MTSSSRPSWILFLLGVGQALGLCLGLLVLFLVVIPELPEPSAASAGLFTLIIGWVMLKPILEQRRAERSERNAFIPPIPSFDPMPAPVPARAFASPGEAPPRRNTWALDRLVGTMAATVFVAIVGIALGPYWLGMKPVAANKPITTYPEVVVPESPGAGSRTSTGLPETQPPPREHASVRPDRDDSMEPPPISKSPPPVGSGARPAPDMPPPDVAPSTPRPLPSAPPRASLSEERHIGPDDLLVLALREENPAQVAFHQAMNERFRGGRFGLSWMLAHPSRHPSSGEEAQSIAARLLAIRAVESREMPSSSDRVKFMRIQIDAVIFINGAELPFQCAHNGLGPNTEVALQKAADRCVRKLLDRLNT